MPPFSNELGKLLQFVSGIFYVLAFIGMAV